MLSLKKHTGVSELAPAISDMSGTSVRNRVCEIVDTSVVLDVLQRLLVYVPLDRLHTALVGTALLFSVCGPREPIGSWEGSS